MARALTDSPAVLKGVGPKKLQALNKLGINTIEELLTYYPFRYEDLTVKQLSDVADGEKVVLKGVIAAPPAGESVNARAINNPPQTNKF